MISGPGLESLARGAGSGGVRAIGRGPEEVALPNSAGLGSHPASLPLLLQEVPKHLNDAFSNWNLFRG